MTSRCRLGSEAAIPTYQKIPKPRIVNPSSLSSIYGNKATIDDDETGYRALIERTQKEVPGARIVIYAVLTTAFCAANPS